MRKLTIDAERASCVVFTRREGLLSRVGHDLELVARRFVIEARDAELEAVFEAASIEPVAAIERGRQAPLSDDDRREIQSRLAREVLEVARFPHIRFLARVRSTQDGYALEGSLELHGVRRPLEVVARRRADLLAASVELHQPDFGMRPYVALFGALRVAASVRVEIALRRELVEGSADGTAHGLERRGE